MRLFKVVRKSFFSSELDFSLKSDNTFVTPVDKKVEEIIVNTISDKFPTDKFLSEETHKKTSWKKGRVWIIDPICGTSNFAFKIPFFTTNITLCLDGVPVLTFSLDYIQQDYYWTAKDLSGVFSRKGKAPFNLKQQNRVVFDFGYLLSRGTKRHEEAVLDIEKELLVKYNIRSYTLTSSLAFVYASVGKKFAGFVVTFTKPWDFVSSAYMVEKNGGIATDFRGKRWSCESEHIIASPSPEIHRRLLSVVKKYRPS